VIFTENPVKFPGLSWLPYELNRVKAAFAPAEVHSKQENADAILGNASLRRFNLIFDYAQRSFILNLVLISMNRLSDLRQDTDDRKFPNIFLEMSKLEI